MLDAAAFGIGSSVEEPGNASVGNGTCAHGAWLKRDPQVAIGQAIGAKRHAGRTDSDNFGVCRGVVARAGGVSTGGDDLAVAHHDSADRHFAISGCLLGTIKRTAHGIGKRKYHLLRLDEAQWLTKAAIGVRRASFRTTEHSGFFTMSRICELTGKGRMVGNNVSHANNKTKRTFLPNLQNVTLMSDTMGESVKLRVSTHGLRSVEHVGGLDNWLAKTSEDKLSLKARRLKRAIAKKAVAIAA